MKKTDLVKFSLTLVSAAVLAACSSGGSASKAAAQPEAKPEVPEVSTPETDAKKDEKPTFGVAEKSFGHGFIKKTDSNLGVDSTGVNHKDSTSGEGFAFDTRLHPSLDTFLVGETTFNSENNIIYLEDFDFRGNDTHPNAPTGQNADLRGKHTLSHIHVYDATKADSNKANDAPYKTRKTYGSNFSEDRTGGSSATKTALKGKGSATALVFHPALESYVERNALNTVAEVYGNRTFLAGDSESAQGTGSDLAKNANVNNAPYQLMVPQNTAADKKEFNFAAGKLDFVQYGRVTSALHGVASIDNDGLYTVDQDGKPTTTLKEGVSAPDLRKGIKYRNTLVGIASYGLFGQKGTENHYFYRSDEALRNPLDVEKLTKLYKDTKVNYYGHAVTYGLNHNWHDTDAKKPNAVGNDERIKSGTHVHAVVNLADNSVEGKLFDVWTFDEDHKNTLVNFEGTLNNQNGAITGKSNLAYGSKAEGTFNANLFGKGIQEMGGAVKSVSTSQNDWGAVFGAKARGAAPTVGGIFGKHQGERVK